MVIQKDLYLVCEVPYIEPIFGVREVEGTPSIIAITTTRDEAYTIALKYLQYKNFKQMYSKVYISYYIGNYGSYMGDVFLNGDFDTIVASFGADVIIDDKFVEDCPLYIHNSISSSLNIVKSLDAFRKMCNWIRDSFLNWLKK